MIAESGQIWEERHNGLFLLVDIIEYNNNVHLYKLFSFRDSRVYDWSNPFSDSIPPNFTVLL